MSRRWSSWSRKRGVSQALGGDVEQVELAVRRGRARPRAAASASRLEFRKAARTPASTSALTWSCISAISGDTTIAVPCAQQRGDLVAQRLAAAGGHQHQGVAARGDVFDDLPAARRGRRGSRRRARARGGRRRRALRRRCAALAWRRGTVLWTGRRKRRTWRASYRAGALRMSRGRATFRSART